MAEFGIIASIIQIADVGLRLSLKLYTFGETVASADRTVLAISKDISLTSSVLKELGHSLERDKQAQICSQNAIKTAEEVVQECLVVFQEIDGLLEKTAGHEGKPMPKWTSAVVGKLKWPFLQPKMQLLRSNLDRLKATLLLMLNVMTYARQVSESGLQASQLDDHRKLIEDLARSKDEYTRKFETLTQSITTTFSVEGNPETHSLIHPTSPESSPELLPTSPGSSRLMYELKFYSGLINKLLRNVEAAERHMEPLLGSRIRDDIIVTHRREALRLDSLHGPERLRATITGKAWDLLGSTIIAEASLAWSGTSQPSATSQTPATLNKAVFGVQPTSLSEPRRAHRWVEPTGSQENENQSEISTRPPIFATADMSFANRRSLSFGRQKTGRPVKQDQHSVNPSVRETATAIDTVPPGQSRNRSASPTEIRSFVRSDSASEGSAEYMDREESDFGCEPAYDFEVKEQDRWLPIANVAKIMKRALPEDAKIAKETKECMQECVSEFISFITSEAAEKCQMEKRKTLGGDDVLFAMTSLGFENYAQVLRIYLTRYHQTVHKKGSVSHPFPSSPNAIPKRATTSPISTQDRPLRTKSQTSGADAFTTAKDHTASHGKDEDEPNDHDNATWPREDGGSKQDSKNEATSVVDHLLSEWTLLTDFR